MTTDDLVRLQGLRSELFAHLRAVLERDGHCKSYEGTFSIIMPTYHQEVHPQEWETEPWALKLDCYLIGPTRHYWWTGATLAACLDRAEADIRRWIKEDELEAE